MSFASVLDAYCNAIGCTNREIANRCGISPSTLSRYRNGERAPEIGGDTLDRLVAGIVELSNEHGVDKAWRADILRNSLETSLSKSKILGMSFGARFDALMDLLNYRNVEMAQALGVSPSYVSRIRSGQRIPVDKHAFAEQCARLFTERGIEQGHLEQLIGLVDLSNETIGVSDLGLDDCVILGYSIELWLLGDNILESDLAALKSLFEKMDNLYFEDVFAEQSARIAGESAGKPVGKPASRTMLEDESGVRCSDVDEVVEGVRGQFSQRFYGKDQMRKAEMLFFETAIANGAKEVFLSSDMPMLDRVTASEATDKHMFYLRNLVRPDAHIIAFHNIERPLAETILSIEMWLPLTLAGKVSAYYLKGATSRLFHHVNYVCESCVLSSEAIRGHQSEGRSYFTTIAEDVAYYRKKMDVIVERATPMLEIYHEDVPVERRDFASLLRTLEKDGAGRIVGAGKYENLSIVSYSTDCAVITILPNPAIHLVIRHPKLCYVISRI